MDTPAWLAIAVQQHDFCQHSAYQRLADFDSACGAVVTFCGLVRDVNLSHQVNGLFLEHYPGMTEKSLTDIAIEAKARWQLGAVTIIHRVGLMQVNEQIVFVGVSAQHRQGAFEACEYIMDHLKTRAPFWKKEHSLDSEKWIEARDSDVQAAQKWCK